MICGKIVITYICDLNSYFKYLLHYLNLNVIKF